MDIMTYGLVFLGWVVGGTIGGSTGMGAVMSAMPFLTWVVAPSDAVIICLLVSLFDCTQLAYLYRKGCVWSEVRDLLIGMIPGVLLGNMALKIISVQAFELMVSALLSMFVVLQLYRIYRKSPYQLPKSLLAGLLAGVACGFVNASVALMGAPLGIYVLLRGWEPNEARGNMSVVFAVTTIFTVATQLMSGMYTMDLLKLSVIGMAGACCGNLIGVRVGRIFDRQRLTKIILVFLTIFAFSLFMRGIK